MSQIPNPEHGSQRSAAGEDLARRDAILETVAFAAQAFLSAHHWTDCIDAVLSNLGRTMGVSRAYLFANHDLENEQPGCSQTHEYCAPKTESFLSDPELLNLCWKDARIVRMGRVLSGGGSLSGPSRELPVTERAHLERQNILSSAVVPVFAGDTFWGFLGFDECLVERRWSAAEMDALDLAAGLLGSSIELGLAQDEKEQAERELEAKRTLSVRADRLRSLGQMAASMAHELNQPLVGVRGLAEHLQLLLEQGEALDPAETLEDVRTIVAQADRMEHIIEHMRLFAREAGRPEREVCSLNKVVEASLELAGARFRAAGLTLERSYARDLPLVLVNPYSLEEVFLNLISNAQDAILERRACGDNDQPDMPDLVIRTTLEEGPDPPRVAVVFSDRGTGISTDVMGHIREPFFSTKGPQQGTGLGIPIAEAIVQDLDGRLTIESELGEGTTVTVSLPSKV